MGLHLSLLRFYVRVAFALQGIGGGGGDVFIIVSVEPTSQKIKVYKNNNAVRNHSGFYEVPKRYVNDGFTDTCCQL